MNTLELRGLYKVFGPSQKLIENALRRARSGAAKVDILRETGCNVAVRDVSMQIQQGEIFVIMGLSGSGKSTLVRHFNRLIEPTAGELLIDNDNVLELNGSKLRQFRRTRMSMVFQSFALLPHKTILENVAFGCLLRGDSRQDAIARSRTWINGRIGLNGYENHYPDELSGGMRQRVGLARALVSDPEVLLMDEAFSALDPLIRRDMQDVLLAMQAELKKTIVFITHDIDEAMRLGNKIAILREGTLIQLGTPEEIKNRPADDYVRKFFEHHD
ncbi:quaternary amine ABC transporter ATP-binding protein [Paraburkholderia fungorum]